MGKKKGQGPKRAFKKDPVATKVAAGVKKTKTKAVVTSLKRMTAQSKSKTEALDAQFAELQQAKTKKAQPSHATPAAESRTEKTLPNVEKKPQHREEEEPDVDMAAEELSKLVS